MSEINPASNLVTHITAIDIDPMNQAELIKLMAERARFMVGQPGFVSLNLHRSTDNRHVVNYVQWVDNAQFEAARCAPGFHAHASRFSALIQNVESSFYDVVLVEEK